MTIPYSNPNDTYFDGLEVATDHRLVYTEVGSTNPKNVYNRAGTSLGNKIDLGSDGTLNPQICLGEGDYDVILQRYVAGDRTLDTSWEDAWPVAYLVSGAPATGVTTSNMAVLATRADLKALPANHGYLAVVMLGYYTAYDGGGGIFVWKADSTTTDDFGYFCELDADPASGRFLYSLQANQQYVSTATYGVLSGLVGACDVRVENALTRAGAIGLKLQFANSPHSFSADVTIDVNSFLPRLAYFTAPDDSSTRVITFDAFVEIEPRSVTYPIARKPYTNIEFTSGIMPDGVSPEWWDDSYTSGAIKDTQVSQAVTNGGGVVRLTESLAYDFPETAITASLIVNQGSQINVAGNTQFDGQISVLGVPYWKIFNLGASGNPVITNKHQGGVYAWWFGWCTSNSDTQATCLNDGYGACRSYNHTYYISKNALGSASYIDIALSFDDVGVSLDISDKLTITDNGELTAVNIPLARRQLFAFDGTAYGSELTLKTGVIYPEWFGAVGNGSTSDSTALFNATLCAKQSSVSNSIVWIDLGGKVFVTAQALGSIENVGYRFGELTYLALSSCNNMKFENVSIRSNGYAVSALTPVNTITSCTNIEFINSSISNSNNAMPLAIYASTGIKFTNSKIIKTVNTGVPFYFDDDSSYEMINCAVNWVSGGNIYITNNAKIKDCTFVSGGSSLVYVGYDGTASAVGSNSAIVDSFFEGCQVHVSGVSNIQFERNQLKGVYTSTFIELAPRATGEPINVIVQDNFMNWTNTPTSECYAVKYTTSFGSYVNPTDYLFGSFAVRNNYTNMPAEAQNYRATNSVVAVARIVRAWKTHGNHMVLSNDGGLGYAVDDNYIGTTMTAMLSVRYNAGTTIDNNLFLNGGIVGGKPSIVMVNQGAPESWTVGGLISTSAIV